jgi:hypothetical protein
MAEGKTKIDPKHVVHQGAPSKGINPYTSGTPRLQNTLVKTGANPGDRKPLKPKKGE